MFAFLGPLAPLLRALVLTSSAILWTLCLARLVGLRAFSKATAFDFAATVATGSLVAQAGTRSDWPSYLQAMAAIGAVFLVQFLLATGRSRSAWFKQLVDNRPLLLMRNGEFRLSAIQSARVSKATLMEKIRSSGAKRLEDVHAIVLETTGDLSIMAGDDFDESLLSGVRGASHSE